MIGSWARARRRPVPDLDVANPPGAYRRTTPAAVRVDTDTQMAATVAEWSEEDLNRLSRHTETMSPWEAARKALRDEEKA